MDGDLHAADGWPDHGIRQRAAGVRLHDDERDEAVPCQISDAAMDELAGTKGTPSIARQAQFVAHREAIERIASDLYDEAPRFKGYVVRIFTKHIQGG